MPRGRAGCRSNRGKFGVSYPNFVWNYNRLIKALLDGNLPTAPTVALAAARKFRAILKNTSPSGRARAYLEANLDELDRRANDTDRREEEAQRAQAQTQEAEARNEIGIYVYALPHYLRYPFEPESRRTLLKVGRSDSDVIERFRNQTRTTALPEEPILLRIYRNLVRRPHLWRLGSIVSWRQLITAAASHEAPAGNGSSPAPDSLMRSQTLLASLWTSSMTTMSLRTAEARLAD